METRDIVSNIPYSININDVNVAPSLLNKQEFLEFRSDPYETSPQNGYFNHQNLIIRYFDAYDRLLNINEAGTGKSSVIAGVCEHFKHKFNSNQTPIRKWFILVPSDTIKREIINDVIKRGNYEREINYSKAANKAKSITTMLKKNNYVFYTYTKFLNDIVKKPDEEIKEMFSNVLFFVDEAHRLLEFTDENENTLSLYTLLWKIFHLSENMKIQLTSATPMINDVTDVIPLINLLNPSDEQISYEQGKMFPYRRGFEYFIKNKISYVRTKRVIEVVDEGEPFKLDSLSAVRINKPEECYYDLYVEGEEEDDLVNDEPESFGDIYKRLQKEGIKIAPGIFNKVDFKIVTDKHSYILINKTIRPSNASVQLEKNVDGKDVEVVKFVSDDLGDDLIYKEFNKRSKFITYQLEMSEHQWKLYSRLPTGSFYGPQDQASVAVTFDRSATESGMILNTNRVYEQLLALPETERLGALKDVSPKFHFIIENERRDYFRVKSSGDAIKGKSYIYYEYIVQHRQFLDIFKLFGYEEATTSIPDEKRPRFCILDASDQIQNKKKLEIFNSDANRYGEYIQIIIFGKAFAEGMNLDSMMKCYITSPQWNYSKLYQIIARGIRATSHNAIINDIVPLEDDVLRMKIYKLACTYKTARTSDLEKYSTIEQKKMNIDIVTQYLKESSFDKVFNRFKNSTFVLLKKVSSTVDTVTCQLPKEEEMAQIKRFLNPYIEQLDTNFIRRVDSLDVRTRTVVFKFSKGSTRFIDNDSVIVIYNMLTKFNKYMIINQIPYISDVFVNKTKSIYLKEYDQIVDYATFNLNYSKEDITMYKNIIAGMVNRSGYAKVNNLLRLNERNPYVIYKAVNELLLDQNHNGLYYKLTNNCLHLSESVGLQSARISTKHHEYTKLPFFRPPVQVEPEVAEEVVEKDRSASVIITEFERMDDREKFTRLYWNKKYARYENKVILEHHLIKFYKAYVNHRSEDDWSIPDFIELNYIGRSDLEGDVGELTFSNPYLDKWTTIIVNMFSFYIYIRYMPIAKDGTSVIENYQTKWKTKPSTTGKPRKKLGKFFIEEIVKIPESHHDNSDLLIFHTYTRSISSSSIQTILSTKRIWDKGYTMLKNNKFVEFNDENYMDVSYLRYLYDLKNDRLDSFALNFNRVTTSNNFKQIYSFLPDVKETVRKYDLDDAYELVVVENYGKEIKGDTLTKKNIPKFAKVAITEDTVDRINYIAKLDPEMKEPRFKTYSPGDVITDKHNLLYHLLEQNRLFVLYV